MHLPLFPSPNAETFRWTPDLENAASGRSLVLTIATALAVAVVVILGTGTPVPDADRTGAGVAIITGGEAYVFDAGGGMVARQGLPLLPLPKKLPT